MKRIFSLLAAVFLSATVLLQPIIPAKAVGLQESGAVQTSAAISTSAKASAIIDLDTGSFIFTKNADERLAIASTTKIMTALCVIEREADLSRIVTVKPEWTGIEGSSMYLKPEERISISDMLYGLLLCSGNDAAVALAAITAGSVHEFCGVMNEKAKQLGMTNSHFANPNGLPDGEHFSTARDMALLAKAAFANKKFVEITSAKTITTDTRTMKNHNKLLWNMEECIGGKTGYTDAAGRCLVSAAERDGMRFAVVTLNCHDHWNEQPKLYEYAFSGFSHIEITKKTEIEAQIAVISGKEATVSVRARGKIVATVPKTAEYKFSLSAENFVYAPVYKGKSAGKLYVTDAQGKEIFAEVGVEFAHSVGVDAKARRRLIFGLF
ncbi:MAG: D-alanyl-D-alanine carboxypeptidase [Oscillospiraceae bacterium]|jgi:D-alanyl-D-alanine carboxypeptidase|nr:D-alanyl-D-alanine carboxypeptidase [Oscillospiraceae bacterium]